MPLKIAEAGIDRYFERYYRKGPRRRPVRIEFCEADVLDAFDDWRRAVGVTRVVADSTGGPDVEDPQPPPRQKKSLATQIESALARLTVLRGSDQPSAAFGAALERAVRVLDALRSDASRARGDARDRIIEQLAAVDAELTSAAIDALDPRARESIEKEADGELSPFRMRMSAEAFNESRRQAMRRLVRERFGLPVF